MKKSDVFDIDSQNNKSNHEYFDINIDINVQTGADKTNCPIRGQALKKKEMINK